MQPSEYKKQLDAISEAAGVLADKIERTEYTNPDDLRRDAAQCLELWQRRADLLKEAIEDDDIITTIDYKSEFGE